MPRSRQPSRTTWMDCGFDISAKYSAGPPMPNDVRVARGSPWRTPASPRSQVRLDPLRQLIAQLSDIACAHQQKNVVRAHQALERLARALKRAHIYAVGNEVRKVASLDAGRVALTRAVDVDHQHPIRIPEGAREVLDQRGKPRVAVRLEDNDQPAVTHLARGLQRGAHLRGMVSVIVVYRRALEDAQELEPPVRARKPRQGARHVLEAHAKLERHRGGRGVLAVVPARRRRLTRPSS